MVLTGWECMCSRMPAFFFLPSYSLPVDSTPASQFGICLNLSYIQLKSPTLQFETVLFVCDLSAS